MKITAIKTHKITRKDQDICKILDRYISTLREKSIVAITSKIVSITQGRMVAIREVSRGRRVSRVSRGETRGEKSQKDMLIEKESQYFLPRTSSKYNVSLTITRNNLAASAGIDESNGAGFYILWPKDPQQTANIVRSHLQKRFKLQNVGVIITDSKTTPLRFGVTAMALAYSGFLPLKDYIGKPDIFGRKFEFEKMSIIDNLACAAALVMGEGNEQTPLAVIEDLPFIRFVNHNPSLKELRSLKISLADDLYAPLLKYVKWKRGKRLQTSS